MNGIYKFEIEEFLNCVWSEIKDWVWRFDKKWNSMVERFLDFLKLKIIFVDLEFEVIVWERRWVLDGGREKCVL